jgi:hypothetical protein
MSLDIASSWSQLVLSSAEILLLVWAGFRYINKLTVRLEKLDDINTRLETIEGQYRPNGGSSMKDAVNRIEKQLDKMQDRLDSHIDHNRKE